MKGQVANQVFIYIMAAIIFSMVLIYGYTAVAKFMEQSDYVGLIDFRMEITSTIDDIATTQDKREKTFVVPGDFEQICFLDMRESDNCKKSPIINPGAWCAQACRPGGAHYGEVPDIVCQAWEDNVTENIFLIPWADIPFETKTIQLFNSTNNRPDEDVGFLCMNITNSRITLNLRGKGDRTQIWQ